MQLTIYRKYNSIRKSIGILSIELDNLKQKLNLSDNDFFKLNICISEIFVNAIYHGNKIDPCKYVEIIIQVSDNNIKISVIDEGEGFVLESIPDPTIEENLLKENGRGLFITQNYAQSINTNQSIRGFCVEFSLPIQ